MDGKFFEQAKESSGSEAGVPTFEYNPSWRQKGLLFEFARPLSELKDMPLDANGMAS